jgi:hypothetical protein
VGNQSRLNFGSGRSIGGLYSTSAGSRRHIGEISSFNWSDGSSTPVSLSSVPLGYLGSSSYYLSQKAGGLSSYNNGRVEGVTGSLNLAGGVNIGGNLAATFDLNSPSLILIVDVSGTVTCVATGTAAIKGLFDLIGSSGPNFTAAPLAVVGVASVDGSSSIFGDTNEPLITGIAGVSGNSAFQLIFDAPPTLSGIAGLTGNSSSYLDSLTALIKGIAQVSGETTAVFEISGELAAAILAAGSASISFSTNVSEIIGYGSIIGDSNATFDLSGIIIEGRPIVGVASISLTEFGELFAKAWANGQVSISLSGDLIPYAIGELAGNITPDEGGTMTEETIAARVWSTNLNNTYSATDLMNILASVSAGKSTITDIGGGRFQVVFRDVEDTTDVITATTEGRERVEVEITP